MSHKGTHTTTYHHHNSMGKVSTHVRILRGLWYSSELGLRQDCAVPCKRLQALWGYLYCA